MTIRRVAGALVLAWCSYRLTVLLAEQPGVRSDLDAVLSRWWPLGIVAVALVAAARAVRPNTSLRGPVYLAVLGLSLLALTTGALLEASWSRLVLPMALMPVGWLLLTYGRTYTVTGQDDSWPKVTAIAEVRHLALNSKALTHGRVTAVLGAVILDLRSSQTLGKSRLQWDEDQPGHGALIDVNAIGGSVDIIVPSTWIVDTTRSFSGARVQNHAHPAASVSLDGRLRVTAMTVAGRVTIRC